MSDTDEGAQRDGDVSLTAEEIDTYKLIAAGEDVPADRPTARLVELGLVADDPYREGRHVALDPRGAAQHLMAAEQAVLSRVIKRIAQIPELEALAAHFEPHRLYGGPGSEFLVSKEQMNVRIGQVIGDAQRELWTAQPGPAQDRDPEVLK